MSDAFMAEVIVKPVKNNANGIDPPTIPIANNFIICCLFNAFISFHFFKITITPMRKIATSEFFNVVYKTGSFTAVTPILFKKFDAPDIAAVANAKMVGYQKDFLNIRNNL